jgi:hypothetical protein
MKEYRQKSPRYSLGSILAQAKRRRPCTVTVDDVMEIFIQQDGRCALSGVKMTWSQGKTLPTSISLDRIDSNKDYHKDNVRLVCVCVNAFKHTMTDDEMLKFAMNIVRKMTNE